MNCSICGWLIAQLGISYGYAGKLCHCRASVHPGLPGGSAPVVLQSVVEERLAVLEARIGQLTAERDILAAKLVALEKEISEAPVVYTDELSMGVWSDVRERMLEPVTHRARLVRIEPIGSKSEALEPLPGALKPIEEAERLR